MGYFRYRTNDSVVITVRDIKENNSPKSNNKSTNLSNNSGFKIKSKNYTYRILKTFSFTSDRKAMSVIA